MKNKTIIRFLIIILFLCTMFLFAGCEKDDFVEVCEIQYTTNGVEKTQCSTWSLVTKNGVERATKEEFNLGGGGYSSPFGAKKLSKSSKTVSFSQDKIGKTFYYAELAWGSGPGFGQVLGKDYDYNYYRYEFAGYSYSYISVKIINDTTIVIRDRQGDTTYTVSSYRATYFD